MTFSQKCFITDYGKATHILTVLDIQREREREERRIS